MNLIEFQNALKSDSSLKGRITGRSDVIDFDNGTAIIYGENLSTYLERYSCKDEDDLCDTLWNSYGVFVKVV